MRRGGRPDGDDATGLGGTTAPSSADTVPLVHSNRPKRHTYLGYLLEPVAF